MTHPLSEPRTYEDTPWIITTLDGFMVDLRDVMLRKGVWFYRHRNGGGFVAENSYVPPHIYLPWDVTVFDNTRVFDNADLVSAGTRIFGNVSRVSRVMRPDEEYLVQCEHGRRVRRGWRYQGSEQYCGCSGIDLRDEQPF